jgi:hypothetical protein
MPQGMESTIAKAARHGKPVIRQKCSDDRLEPEVDSNAPTLKLPSSPFLANSRLPVPEWAIEILKDVKCKGVV